MKDFGEKVYEIKGGSAWLRIFSALATMGLLVGLVVAIPEKRHGGGIGQTIVAGFIFIILLGSIITFFNASKTLECFENGVRCSGLLGSNELAYEEVSVISYNAVHHYTNSQYDSTQYSFRFNNSWEFSFSGGMVEPEASELLAGMTAIIAAEMFIKFQSGQDVNWGSGLIFTSSGLEYRDQVIPYGEIDGEGVSEGQYFINHSSGSITGSIVEDNFFPGVEVLKRILSETPKSSSETKAQEGNKSSDIKDYSLKDHPSESPNSSTGKNTLGNLVCSVESFPMGTQLSALVFSLIMFIAGIAQLEKSMALAIVFLLFSVGLFVFFTKRIVYGKTLHLYTNAIGTSDNEVLFLEEIREYCFRERSLFIVPSSESKKSQIVFPYEDNERGVAWNANFQRITQKLSEVAQEQE